MAMLGEVRQRKGYEVSGLAFRKRRPPGEFVAGLGPARLGLVRRGQARLGRIGHGEARGQWPETEFSICGRARPGRASFGSARSGQSGRGRARRGMAWRRKGSSGTSTRGET